MKLRNRISLFYTLITALFMGAVFLTIILIGNRYIDRLFNSYLADKALLCAQKNWEQDELSESRYKQIINQYQSLLPTAEEVVVNSAAPQARQTLERYLSSSQIAQLYHGEPIHFRAGTKQGLALYYQDNEGSFVVLVMEENFYGNSLKRYFIVMLSVLFVLSCLVIFIAGRLHADHTLRPLKRLLHEVSDIDATNLPQQVTLHNNDDEIDHLSIQINDMLDRLYQSLLREKDFVRNASHQLNNPLTILRGECEVALLRQRTPEEYQQSLQKILSTEERMSHTIKQLLLLAHGNEQVNPTSLEIIDLSYFLQEICADNSRLSYTMPNPSPSWMVSTEYYMLSTALESLISNACKYSTQEVCVELFTQQGSPSIRISDTGIGIPAQELDHIYQPFYRASNTQGIEGQGIGLSLCFHTCQTLGINLSVTSQEGKGTQFTLQFPAQAHTIQ